MKEFVEINPEKRLSIDPKEVSACGVEKKNEMTYIAWFDLKNGRTYHSKVYEREVDCVALVDKIKEKG